MGGEPTTAPAACRAGLVDFSICSVDSGRSLLHELRVERGDGRIHVRYEPVDPGGRLFARCRSLSSLLHPGAISIGIAQRACHLLADINQPEPDRCSRPSHKNRLPHRLGRLRGAQVSQPQVLRRAISANSKKLRPEPRAPLLSRDDGKWVIDRSRGLGVVNQGRQVANYVIGSRHDVFRRCNSCYSTLRTLKPSFLDVKFTLFMSFLYVTLISKYVTHTSNGSRARCRRPSPVFR